MEQEPVLTMSDYPHDRKFPVILFIVLMVVLVFLFFLLTS